MFSLLFFLIIIFGPGYPSTDFLNKILFSSQNPPYPKSNLHSERLLRVEEEERESSPIRMRVAESRDQFFTNPVCDSSLHLLFSERLCYIYVENGYFVLSRIRKWAIGLHWKSKEYPGFMECRISKGTVATYGRCMSSGGLYSVICPAN